MAGELRKGSPVSREVSSSPSLYGIYGTRSRKHVRHYPPLAKKYKIAAINWGFVAGKTQTFYPWDSWRHPYILDQPTVWFHEVLHPDGKPYRDAEVKLIRELTVEERQAAKGGAHSAHVLGRFAVAPEDAGLRLLGAPSKRLLDPITTGEVPELPQLEVEIMPSRRQFLQQASTAAVALSSTTLFGRLASAQTSSTADQTVRILVDGRRSISPLDRNLFGSFLEQLGRAIYEGIYDPGSKLSDSNGFRKDVMQEIRTLGVPIIRYPGGNFVSGYNWLDGVGPKQDRPRVLDKAWNTVYTNQLGTNEYMAWCKAVGTLPLMGLNLGTGTPEQAAALLEYCNVDQGTKWSDLRRKHGYAEPYNVKNWCLGNEMDGPWQIGHMTATEYGMKAQDTARQMRYVDHSVQLIACGSSGPFMPTYLEWDREVLEQCYENVDGLSLHRYLGNNQETGEDSAKYLAMNLTMDRQIAETLAVCDLVRGHKRSPEETLALVR